MAMEGKRGGVHGIDEAGDVSCCCSLGTSGRVMEGAGLGDGIVRIESRERR